MSQMINTDVARDPEQPGLEDVSPFELRQRQHHSDENRLAQILVLMTLTGLRDHEARDAALVVANQILERAPSAQLF